MVEEAKNIKTWQKRMKNKKEWYEFSFNSKVKIFQGTKSFNPLDVVKGENVGLIQIHSSVIHQARTDIRLVGDGLFTGKRGLNLYIRTADCLAMIFYHPEAKVLALLHTGWKGTVLLIAKKFLLRMKQLYDFNFCDWEVTFGPCIAPENYEVGKEVFEFFDKFNLSGIYSGNNSYFLNLEEANIKMLRKMGVENIYSFPEKTYTSGLFYSYRKGDAERNITLGVIEP
jgi:YfiH family protein